MGWGGVKSAVSRVGRGVSPSRKRSGSCTIQGSQLWTSVAPRGAPRGGGGPGGWGGSAHNTVGYRPGAAPSGMRGRGGAGRGRSGEGESALLSLRSGLACPTPQ